MTDASASGRPSPRRAGARRARPGRARPRPRRRLPARLPRRRPLAHRDPLRARAPRRWPSSSRSPRGSTCRSTGSARAAASGCSPTPRSPRWSRPAPNATSSSACSPARAAPGTSAPPPAPTRGGGGLRARGHDAVAGCVEDAVRATELGVQVPARRRRGRAVDAAPGCAPPGIIPADTTLKVSALIGPGQPGLVRGVRAARRRLDQRAQRPDARPPHRDPPGRPPPRWTCTSRPPTTSAATCGCTRSPS